MKLKELSFTKMQAYGNDYVYIETFTQKLCEEKLNELAKFLSARHFGVGSDGMILVCPSDKADFRMRVFDPDGTEAEMCGNATRSVGKLVYTKGFTNKTDFTLETLGGIKKLHLFVENGNVVNICANIGAPILDASKVPADCGSERCIDCPVTLDGRTFHITAISLGNPHGVCFVEDIDHFELEKYGPMMEHHPMFKDRINAEFCEVIDRHTLKLRTWERGTGETLACGTGSSTCVVGGVLTGRCDREADVIQVGGTTKIKWDENDGCIYMTAPSQIVFDGKIMLSEEYFA